MKTIKYLLWMIILAVLGIFIYQNLDYFMTKTILKIDLKINSWNWTIPELQNLAYFGICFFLGFIIAAFRGFIIKLGLKKEIKTQNTTISSLKDKLNELKSELDVFQHDPYIKKEIDKETIVQPIELDRVEPEQSEPVQPIPEPFEEQKLDSESHDPEPIESDQLEFEPLEPEQPEPDQPIPAPLETENKEGDKSNTAD
jgi:hypothetical protein